MNRLLARHTSKNWLLWSFKKSGRLVLRVFGLLPVKKVAYENLLTRVQLAETRLKWISTQNLSSFEKFIDDAIIKYPFYSQLQQDLVAYYVHALTSEEPGYFVEFGASDGVTYSNTFLLEEHFQWNGILAEPARKWKKQLQETRQCIIDVRCVWKDTGSLLKFNEAREGEYSTLDRFSNSDSHAVLRMKGKKYDVETISLLDLLIEHNAPKFISYLSVDTEGSEFEILEKFDFSRYKFRFVSLEHNYNENRDKLKNLMVANGYVRILEEYSEWDDWYVPSEYCGLFSL